MSKMGVKVKFLGFREPNNAEQLKAVIDSFMHEKELLECTQKYIKERREEFYQDPKKYLGEETPFENIPLDIFKFLGTVGYGILVSKIFVVTAVSIGLSVPAILGGGFSLALLATLTSKKVIDDPLDKIKNFFENKEADEKLNENLTQFYKNYNKDLKYCQDRKQMIVNLLERDDITSAERNNLEMCYDLLDKQHAKLITDKKMFDIACYDLKSDNKMYRTSVLIKNLNKNIFEHPEMFGEEFKNLSINKKGLPELNKEDSTALIDKKIAFIQEKVKALSSILGSYDEKDYLTRDNLEQSGLTNNKDMIIALRKLDELKQLREEIIEPEYDQTITMA